MKTNLAFALETTIETTDTNIRTLDPVQLDQLLSAQPGARPRTLRARRKLISLRDNHSSAFPAFRVR
jgi:hypothetical protein